MPVEEQPVGQTEQQAASSAGTENTEIEQPERVPPERFAVVNRRMREAEAKLAEAQKRAEEAEKAKLVEQQQFQKLYEAEQKRAEGLAAKMAEAEATMRRNAITAAVEAAARTAQFADPADAHAFLKLDAIELIDGKPQGIDKLIADLAKTKPYLLTTVTPTPGNGQAPKPAGAAGDAERDAKAKRRFEQTVRSW